jgi:enamine deaminase RidA (YjgF/YER057c/UK114 family)
VPAVRSGTRLFVAGHDPERDGQLVYRGRVGKTVPVGDTCAALRLATANALASAREAAGSLERVRCLLLIAFVSTATPEGLNPDFLEGSLALLTTVVGGSRPAVWLRPAQGLAAGMPVEVELVLEARRGKSPTRAVKRPRRGAPAGARAPRRYGVRTS